MTERHPTLPMRLTWNTGRHYDETGQTIFIEWGYDPSRPGLLAFADLSRGIYYIYDLEFNLDDPDYASRTAIRRLVMDRYDLNRERAKDLTGENYITFTAWRNRLLDEIRAGRIRKITRHYAHIVDSWEWYE